MTFIAQNFTTALDAGLILWGQDNDGAPEWVGDREAWTRFEQMAMGDEMTRLSKLNWQ